MTVKILPVEPEDREWVRQFLLDYNHSLRVVSRGMLHFPGQLPGFKGVIDEAPMGLLTYTISGGEMEVVTLHAAERRRGLGAALLAAARELAKAKRCERLWLITTNDNRPAIAFYKGQGMEQVAVHHNALELSRRLKPEIPLIGLDGMPIRDEIEFEYRFV